MKSEGTSNTKVWDLFFSFSKFGKKKIGFGFPYFVPDTVKRYKSEFLVKKSPSILFYIKMASFIVDQLIYLK